MAGNHIRGINLFCKYSMYDLKYGELQLYPLEWDYSSSGIELVQSNMLNLSTEVARTADKINRTAPV
jgi:hypothetical protein